MNGEGIMALPERQTAEAFNPYQDPKVAAAYDSIRQRVSPKEFSTSVLESSSEMDPQTTEELLFEIERANLPPDVIQGLEELIQAIFENPEQYSQIRAVALERDVPEELLPETLDISYLLSLRMALDTAGSGETAMRPPLRMARGGLASLPDVPMSPVAESLRGMGRNGDTMLAHITPSEAALLRSVGGSGTINPRTGLPEFFLKKLGKSIAKKVKSIGKAVKKFASSTLGKIVISVAAGFFLGPAAASLLSGAAASAGFTTAAAALTSKVGVAAVSGFVGNFSSSVAAGEKLGDALKSGATGALTAGAFAGVTGGADAFKAGSYTGPTTIEGRWDQAKAVVTGDPLHSSKTISVDPADIPADSLDAYISPSGFPSPDAAALLETATPQPAPTSFAPSPQDFNTAAPAAQAAAAPVSDALVMGSPARDFGAQPPLSAPAGAPSPLDFDVTGAPLETVMPPQGIDLSSVPSYSTPPLRAGDTSLGQGTVPTISGGGSPSTNPNMWERAQNFYQNPSFDNFYDVLVDPNARTPLGKYGPLALTGTLATAALGGFEAPPTDPTPLDFDPMTGEKIGGPSFKEQRPDLFAEDRKLSEPGFKLSETIVEPPRYGVMPQRGASPYSAPPFTLQPGGIPQPYNREGMYGIPMLYMAKSGSGIMGVEKFPRKTGPINGPGTGTSDSIPAMLSDGEFVFTAKAVRNMGNGSRRKGAARMYKMMKMLEGGPVGAAAKKG
jgi:hypothetical protein